MKLPKGFNEFETVSPNHAIEPDKLSDELFLGYGMEEKYDGSHYQARFVDSGLAWGSVNVMFTSRRVSAKTGRPVDKTANLPHLALGPRALHSTLLLGEIVHRDRGFKNVIAVMGAKPEKAIVRQKESGFLTYVIFDCPFYMGSDIRNRCLRYRQVCAANAGMLWRKYLLNIRRSNFGKDNIQFSFHRFTSTVATTKQLKQAYCKIVKEGGEGLMLKDLDAPYGKGVTKCKKAADVSVVVIDRTAGLGKFKGLLGSITFGVYCYNGLHKPKKLVEIGQASGMDDETRVELSKNFHEYAGKVIDVRCQFPDEPDKFDVTEDRLRHPRFLRLRPDIASCQCTDDKLIADFKRMID